jgi:hypothetical protein
MSNISTIRDDLITKIAAAVGVSVVVEKFAGREVAMGSEKPAIYIWYAGGDTTENIEIRTDGATSIQQDVFHVYIVTEDITASDGDDAAATLLEQCRDAIAGKLIGSLGYAEPQYNEFGNNRNEAPLEASAGSYMYGQAWRIEQYNS